MSLPRFLRSFAALATTLLFIGACAAVAPTRSPSPSSSSPRAASPSPSVSATASTQASSAAATAGAENSWLVFAWFPEKLYLVRPDGSDRHALELTDTDGASVDGVPFAPSWSSDGERILFVIREGDDAAIWSAAADGSDARLVYEHPDCLQSFWPSMSPDGTKLAMACFSETGTSSVSVLDLDTMERDDLATFDYPEGFDNPPSWSPDGSMLSFEIIKWDPTDQFVESSVVAVVPTDGGEVTRLTEPDLMAGHPDWSPDGSLIAFNDYDTGNIHGIDEPSNVYTIEPDGTDMTQLSTASVNGMMRLGQPFWSIDGSRIWVSIARDWEQDVDEQFKNTLGWVDAETGEFTEIGTAGKRFRERPTDTP